MFDDGGGTGRAVPIHINVTVYYLQPLPHFDTLNKTLNGNKNEDSC